MKIPAACTLLQHRLRKFAHPPFRLRSSVRYDAISANFCCSSSSDRIIVVLEKACLETVKVGKNYELLNCDDHAHILKKHKREAAECRPDISHQVSLHHHRCSSNVTGSTLFVKLHHDVAAVARCVSMMTMVILAVVSLMLLLFLMMAVIIMIAIVFIIVVMGEMMSNDFS